MNVIPALLVLFWLATPGRETSLWARLAAHPAVTSGALVVAGRQRHATLRRTGLGVSIGTSGRVRLGHLTGPPDS